jgi:hypothetical protein
MFCILALLDKLLKMVPQPTHRSLRRGVCPQKRRGRTFRRRLEVDELEARTLLASLQILNPSGVGIQTLYPDRSSDYVTWNPSAGVVSNLAGPYYPFPAPRSDNGSGSDNLDGVFHNGFPASPPTTPINFILTYEEITYFHCNPFSRLAPGAVETA